MQGADAAGCRSHGDERAEEADHVLATLVEPASPERDDSDVRVRARLAQLEDNVKALDIELSPEERSRLDALTKPTFGFPQSMAPWFPAIHHGGSTVNGVSAPVSPFGPQPGDDIY